MILPARTILIALLAFALFPATTALAGPPLLCPEAVFTEAETLALSKVAKDAKPDEKVRVVLSLLAGSDSARFRGETLRWFRLSHSKSFAPLLRAIEARVERLGDKATALDRFDRALAVILEDWDGKAAKESRLFKSNTIIQP